MWTNVGSVITRLRTVLFEKIIRQDISFHDHNRSGELISRLSTDTVLVGRTLTSNIADGFRSLVMSSAGLGAMMYVNVQLTVRISLPLTHQDDHYDDCAIYISDRSSIRALCSKSHKANNRRFCRID